MCSQVKSWCGGVKWCVPKLCRGIVEYDFAMYSHGGVK